MKFDKHLAEKDQVEITTQKEIEKKHVLLTTIRPHKGHTLFEINVMTGEVKPAEFETENANYEDAVKGNYSAKKSITANPGCMYISALNKGNAISKLKKEFMKREQLIKSKSN